MLGGLLGAKVTSWVGQIMLAPTDAGSEPDATTSEPVREVISTMTGVAIIPVLIALLLVRSPRWEVALLLVSRPPEFPG